MEYLFSLGVVDRCNENSIIIDYTLDVVDCSWWFLLSLQIAMGQYGLLQLFVSRFRLFFGVFFKSFWFNFWHSYRSLGLLWNFLDCCGSSLIVVDCYGSLWHFGSLWFVPFPSKHASIDTYSEISEDLIIAKMDIWILKKNWHDCLLHERKLCVSQ